MAYVALKPCSFAGQSFKIGESIPADLIQPGAAKNLLKMQVIAAATDSDSEVDAIVIPDPTFSILIRTEDGERDLEPTDEGIRDVFSVLIGNAADAEPVVNQMTDVDALVLLQLSDSRSSVKKLAKARVTALSEGEQ